METRVGAVRKARSKARKGVPPLTVQTLATTLFTKIRYVLSKLRTTNNACSITSPLTKLHGTTGIMEAGAHVVCQPDGSVVMQLGMRSAARKLAGPHASVDVFIIGDAQPFHLVVSPFYYETSKSYAGVLPKAVDAAVGMYKEFVIHGASQTLRRRMNWSASHPATR